MDLFGTAPAAEVPDTAERFIPPNPTLAKLKKAAAGCTGCPLFAHATQTVFGDGPADAPMMLVGEQPGDVEDTTGLPFVGPAGKLLDRCLLEAGIDRGRAYVTNAVKHFKWEPRGKRRIHSKPNAMEVRACNPWLQSEIAVIRPKILVCLGATAAQALLGRTFRVSQQRGSFLQSPLAPYVMATVHPSALLRADPAVKDQEIALFIRDLRKAGELLH